MSAVTREDAISFLETACRNWRKVPKLSEEDIGDVATALLQFVSLRSGGEEKNGVGSGLIDSMSEEEFNRDRSDENPNVGRKVEAQPLHPLPMPPYHFQAETNALTYTDLSLRAENERLKAQVEALMTERTSLIETKREQIERLTKERDAALEAEDEAKECYWAVYPTYVAVHGEGMSAEAAHTDLSARATTAEAKLEEAAKVLEPIAAILDGGWGSSHSDHVALTVVWDPDHHGGKRVPLRDFRAVKSFVANLKGAE